MSHNQEKDVIKRRYSDFEWLYLELKHKYSKCIIPPIPKKNYKAKIGFESEVFQNKRLKGLQFFMDKLRRNKRLHGTPEFDHFLLPDKEF